MDVFARPGENMDDGRITIFKCSSANIQANVQFLACLVQIQILLGGTRDHATTTYSISVNYIIGKVYLQEL